MTEAYDKLQTEPQTAVNLSNLSYDERAEVRKIAVDGPSHNTPANAAGSFTTVYYLKGDERAAAKQFIEANRTALGSIDVSRRDVLQTNLDRSLYDLILHELGERVRTTYDTVVLEARPDGTQWLIDREVYDHQPTRRYSATDQWAARVDDLSLQALYEQLDSEITETMLHEHAAVTGNVRQVLDYYRVCEQFACQPYSTTDGELAVRKQ